MASEKNSKELLQRKQLSQQGSRAPLNSSGSPQPRADKARREAPLFRLQSLHSLLLHRVATSICTLSNQGLQLQRQGLSGKSRTGGQPVRAATGACSSASSLAAAHGVSQSKDSSGKPVSIRERCSQCR